MTKTKIEWADYTWNPVWGCLNDCRYCYAKKIAHRFGKDFSPHWVESNWLKPFPKDAKRVFVNSMSDIMYWEDGWWNKVMQVINDSPDIDFIFLTKGGTSAYPERIFFPNNCILGFTATEPKLLIGDEEMRLFTNRLDSGSPRTMLNLEPLISSFAAVNGFALAYYDWLIVGAETGNSKGVVVPKYSWYEKMLSVARVMEIPAFVKPSLKDITPEHVYRQQFPWRNNA